MRKGRRAVPIVLPHILPGSSGAWSKTGSEDAAIALADALRARRSDDPQEAAWAARHAYEAIDYFVIAATGVTPDNPGSEMAVLSNPLVQAELARQQRDLQELADLAKSGEPKSGLLELRARSEREAEVFFRLAT